MPEPSNTEMNFSAPVGNAAAHVAGNQKHEQNVIQRVGTNQGLMQAVAAGHDTNVNQQTNQGIPTDEITQEQAIELLAQIETLLKNTQESSRAKEVIEEAADYTSMAKKEAQKKEPRKLLVLGNLEGAITLLKNLNTGTESAKELISNLKPYVLKLAGWLGVAASHFWE
jgi:hypothetical protein